MPAILHITVDSNLSEIAPACRAARAACAGILPAEGLDAVELSLAEAMSHAIRHAYGGAPGHALEISVETGRGEVAITVTDTGAPMPDGLLAAAGAGVFAFDPHCPRAVWAWR